VFQGYSERARQAIFLARLMAGQRGSSILDMPDLVAALVAEDQGEFLKRISVIRPELSSSTAIKRHKPFLTSGTATKLRTEIEGSMVHSDPIPSDTDIPASDSVKRTFKEATTLAEGEEWREVQPLHLLAAALRDETGGVASILRRAGVTEGAILKALRKRRPKKPDSD